MYEVHTTQLDEGPEFPLSNTTTSTDNTDSHDFVVTVSGCTKEQAERVMGERLLHDEDYGFFYTLEYRESR